jgi:hypothetical protein
LSRLFLNNPNSEPPSNLMYYRSKWNTQAYPQNNGRGTPSIKDTSFIEMTHYGLIDSNNNSIIPNTSYLVDINGGRLLDFVADSYSLLRLNYTTALKKGQITNEGSLFGNMDIIQSYTNPRKRYGEFLDGILRYYNETHIPNVVGKYIIASHKDYVNHFFNFLLNYFDDNPITLTRWNTSIGSNILDTGLAFMYADIDYENDFLKAQQILDTPCFPFIRNLTLNMGFSIIHRHPNILLYDVSSPAGSSIRNSYGLLTLEEFFNLRFIKTYTIDNNILYNTINNNYNKYVFKNPYVKNVYAKCGKTVSEEINLSTVDLFARPFSDLEEIRLYCLIRNKEEGSPFSSQKVESIYKKAKYFLKKVDKPSAMSYINNMFRDQVWNKNNGYHDLRKKYFGQTQTEAQRQQTGGGPTSGGSSY